MTAALPLFLAALVQWLLRITDYPDAALKSFRESYPFHCRLWHVLFMTAPWIATFSLVPLGGNVINGSMDQMTLILALLLDVPLWVAFYFSRRLIRMRVSEYNYVKGTSVGRELISYWIVLVVVAAAASWERSSARLDSFGATIFLALSVVAISRVLGQGYKDFREAQRLGDQ